jgi:predicted DNA-binding transcriptional regulator AlpA
MKFRILLTLIEVCEILNMARGTAYNALSQGRFPLHPIYLSKRNIRFDPAELEAFIKSKRE